MASTIGLLIFLVMFAAMIAKISLYLTSGR